eukprot:gb/GECH01013339.1/.p1 GENE.gb/GECH01013339.1/~~gb/GECH01013339.1/.p1  ORF type:complete len:330 (+),score=83.12 gb/GECH01013339.1/:1-990(+)
MKTTYLSWFNVLTFLLFLLIINVNAQTEISKQDTITGVAIYPDRESFYVVFDTTDIEVNIDLTLEPEGATPQVEFLQLLTQKGSEATGQNYAASSNETSGQSSFEKSLQYTYQCSNTQKSNRYWISVIPTQQGSYQYQLTVNAESNSCSSTTSSNALAIAIPVVLCAVVLLVMVVCCGCCIYYQRKKRAKPAQDDNTKKNSNNSNRRTNEQRSSNIEMETTRTDREEPQSSLPNHSQHAPDSMPPAATAASAPPPSLPSGPPGNYAPNGSSAAPPGYAEPSHMDPSIVGGYTHDPSDQPPPSSHYYNSTNYGAYNPYYGDGSYPTAPGW